MFNNNNPANPFKTGDRVKANGIGFLGLPDGHRGTVVRADTPTTMQVVWDTPNDLGDGCNPLSVATREVHKVYEDSPVVAERPPSFGVGSVTTAVDVDTVKLGLSYEYLGTLAHGYGAEDFPLHLVLDNSNNEQPLGIVVGKRAEYGGLRFAFFSREDLENLIKLKELLYGERAKTRGEQARDILGTSDED